MSAKLFCFIACICAVYAQHPPAAQFPAGVNPALCPSYPNCDNALLHNPPAARQQQWGAPAPAQWGAQTWGAPAPAWDAPALHGPVSNHLGGDKYPAGVSPQSCPNYPFCDTNAAGYVQQVAPLPGFTERLYPAGVSPHECPNFPYCN